jgi:hypothetical protein
MLHKTIVSNVVTGSPHRPMICYRHYRYMKAEACTPKHCIIILNFLKYTFVTMHMECITIQDFAIKIKHFAGFYLQTPVRVGGDPSSLHPPPGGPELRSARGRPSAKLHVAEL